MTAQTLVAALNLQQAKAILVRLYGIGNVFSITDVMHESPRTCQIMRQDVFSPPTRHLQHPSQKSAPVEFSCVSEADSTTRVLSPAELQVKALADKAEDYKQQEKTMKARQQMAKAQQNLMKASRGSSAS